MTRPAHGTRSSALLAALSLLLAACNSSTPPSGNDTGSPSPSQGGSSGVDSALERQLTPDAALEDAFRDQTSNLQVLVGGSVSRLLSDDVEGDRHQRFILALSSGQTLLVAHNIDIGQRAPVVPGTRAYVYGEYEWNAEGGVVHWTHRDPDGGHVDGWIQVSGTRYQ